MANEAQDSCESSVEADKNVLLVVRPGAQGIRLEVGGRDAGNCILEGLGRLKKCRWSEDRHHFLTGRVY